MWRAPAVPDVDSVPGLAHLHQLQRGLGRPGSRLPLHDRLRLPQHHCRLVCHDGDKDGGDVDVGDEAKEYYCGGGGGGGGDGFGGGGLVFLHMTLRNFFNIAVGQYMMMMLMMVMMMKMMILRRRSRRRLILIIVLSVVVAAVSSDLHQLQRGPIRSGPRLPLHDRLRLPQHHCRSVCHDGDKDGGDDDVDDNAKERGGEIC